jgi:hypothetical protein
MCPIAAEWTYSKVVYDENGTPQKITGPEGDLYDLYLEDELYTALFEEANDNGDFKSILLPVDKSLYTDQEISLALDFESMMSKGEFNFWWDDGKNKCYLNAGVVNMDEEINITSAKVEGCESIGWTVAEFPTDETIIGPDGVEYFIYADIEEYKQDLQDLNNN